MFLSMKVCLISLLLHKCYFGKMCKGCSRSLGVGYLTPQTILKQKCRHCPTKKQRCERCVNPQINVMYSNNQRTDRERQADCMLSEAEDEQGGNSKLLRRKEKKISEHHLNKRREEMSQSHRNKALGESQLVAVVQHASCQRDNNSAVCSCL